MRPGRESTRPVSSGGTLSRSIGPRLSLVTYLVLIAVVPIGIGAWLFSREAAANAEQRADAGLTATFRSAIGEFEEAVEDANRQAEALAGQEAVQRALGRRDRTALARLVRRQPNASFLSGTDVLAGRSRALAARVDVEVVSGERSLGHVVVTLPFDRALLERLARAAALAPDERLLIVDDGSIVRGLAGPRGMLTLPDGRPDDVRLAGARFRALSGRISVEEQGVRLVVATPRERVDVAVSDARTRVLLGSLGALAAIALVAYALAPAISRSRLAQQQRAQAAHVLSNVGDGVMLLDRSGVVGFWNPAAEAITGREAQDVTGRPVAEALPGWGPIEQLIPVASGPEEVGEHWRPKTVPLEVGERELWLSVAAVDVGEGTVYTFRNLTEERRLDELKTDFVATVSHELRTPLAAVHGAAMTLQQRGSSLSRSDRAELLGLIYEQSDRLARLIDDILVAGQLDSGRLDVARESFDAVELVREVLAELPPRLLAGVSIDIDSPGWLPRVQGDSGKARQVLTNLIENAVKYSPDGGRIAVGLSQSAGRARFSVTDEGIGIPAGEQDRIFEKFYRVDPSMRRGIGGTGLGLYICRELIRHMQGRLWVASRPGGGSTFSFELPLAERGAEVVVGVL